VAPTFTDQVSQNIFKMKFFKVFFKVNNFVTISQHQSKNNNPKQQPLQPTIHQFGQRHQISPQSHLTNNMDFLPSQPDPLDEYFENIGEEADFNTYRQQGQKFSPNYASNNYNPPDDSPSKILNHFVSFFVCCKLSNDQKVLFFFYKNQGPKLDWSKPM
jgi:hypothetical protein